MSKKCVKCGKEYPATTKFFYPHKRRKDGLSSYCQECKKEYSKNYLQQNPEKVKATKRQYRKNNREKVNARIQKYRKIHWENWKGYCNVHYWAKNNVPKPTECSICHEDKPLDVCSINHTYNKNLIEWIWLCRGCHYLFDNLCSIRAISEV